MSLYDCVFQQTDSMKKSFHSISKDSFEKNIWDYKVLSQTDTVEQMNQQMRVSYSWDGVKKIIVSYNTLATLNVKVNYIKNNKLDEDMFWKLSRDRNDSDSLIVNVSILIIKLLWSEC